MTNEELLDLLRRGEDHMKRFTDAFTLQERPEWNDVELGNRWRDRVNQLLRSQASVSPEPAAGASVEQRLIQCLQSLMADLADLLDADQFNNIEARVLAAGVPYPPLGIDPRSTHEPAGGHGNPCPLCKAHNLASCECPQEDHVDSVKVQPAFYRIQHKFDKGRFNDFSTDMWDLIIPGLPLTKGEKP